MRDDEKLTIVYDGGSLELSPSSDYFWKGQSGMGGTTAEIYTADKADRPGSKITGKHVVAKPITVYGQINDKVTDYETAREVLLRSIRAGMEVLLVYECANYTRHCNATVQSAPDPARGIFPEFDIDFFRESPFWREGDGQSRRTTGFNTYEPNLIFPIVIPEEGLQFAVQTAPLLANIVNNGDEELPLTVQFIALAPTSNPSLINVVTRETLTVATDMLEGDAITVETDDDLLTATLLRDGVETNIFNLVQEDAAAWLKLHKGSNYLRAGADNDVYITVLLADDEALYDGV